MTDPITMVIKRDEGLSVEIATYPMVDMLKCFYEERNLGVSAQFPAL